LHGWCPVIFSIRTVMKLRYANILHHSKIFCPLLLTSAARARNGAGNGGAPPRSNGTALASAFQSCWAHTVAEAFHRKIFLPLHPVLQCMGHSFGWSMFSRHPPATPASITGRPRTALYCMFIIRNCKRVQATQKEITQDSAGAM
jgi:hypothetical protein